MTEALTSTRRKDTYEINHSAKNLAERLLRERGFQVFNRNETYRQDRAVTGIVAHKNGRNVEISVKVSRMRAIHFNSNSLENLPDAAFVIVIMAPSKNEEIDFEAGRYEILVVPGKVAREEALEVHRHYWSGLKPKYAVRLKDKRDTSPKTRSGEFFHSWRRRFQNAWHVLEN